MSQLSHAETQLTQGQLANAEGESNALDIRNALRSHGFDDWPIRVACDEAAVKTIADQSPRIGGDVPCRFAEQVSFTSIWGRPYKVQFLLHARHWPMPLALQSYSQTVSGSAVEGKVEVFLQSAIERFHCPGVLLLTGTHWHAGHRQRVRNMIEGGAGKVLELWTHIDDFRRWITSGAPYPEPPPLKMG